MLLLGMHRSGTSCLAGCLQELGLQLGEVYLRNTHNPKGNRERRDVMALNDALLADHGSRWDAPVVVSEGSVAQVRERDRIITDLAGSDQPWGFKDPRTLFTLPFWQQALPHARLVGTFRHPLAVAGSLVTRNRFSIEQGLALWDCYNQRLLALAEKHDIALIGFDLPPPVYRYRLRKLASWLELPNDAPPEFLDPALCRHSDADGECPPEYQRLYRQLQACSERFWSRIS